MTFTSHNGECHIAAHCPSIHVIGTQIAERTETMSTTNPMLDIDFSSHFNGIIVSSSAASSYHSIDGDDGQSLENKDITPSHNTGVSDNLLYLSSASFAAILKTIRIIQTEGAPSNPIYLSVDLSSCMREIEDEGAICLTNALSSLHPTVRVQRLILPGMGISVRGLSAIASFLCNDNANCLEEISLSYNYLRKEGVGILANELLRHNNINPLRILRLENVGMDDRGMEYLRQGISNNNNLSIHSLYIGDNPLSRHGIHQLRKLLEENPDIDTISLYAANLGDEGVEILAKELQTRRVVHLGRNLIGGMGAWALSKVIANNTSLKELRLNGNQTLGKIDNADGGEGWEAFAKALEGNSTLRLLDLTNCGIENEGVVRLANSLRYNYFLREVILRGNYKIGADGMKSLIKCLFDVESLDSIVQSNHTLVNFDFYDSMSHSIFSRQLLKLCECNEKAGPVYSRMEKIICCLHSKPWLIPFSEIDVEILPYALEILTRRLPLSTLFEVIRNMPNLM